MQTNTVSRKTRAIDWLNQGPCAPDSKAEMRQCKSGAAAHLSEQESTPGHPPPLNRRLLAVCRLGDAAGDTALGRDGHPRLSYVYPQIAALIPTTGLVASLHGGQSSESS